MSTSRLRESIEKLAIIGQEAGFSTEQMIELLNAGVEMNTLLDLISWRLEQSTPLARVISPSSLVV